MSDTINVPRELLHRIEETAICDGVEAGLDGDLFNELVSLLQAPVQPAQELRTPQELSAAGCNCVRYGEGNPHWPCRIHPAQPAQVQGWKIVGYARKDELESLLSEAPIDGKHIRIGLDHPICWADEPPYEWLTPLYLAAAPKPPVQDKVPCSTHPDAPHGFNRNSSHSLDRYVCDCEGWVPPVQQCEAPSCGCADAYCKAWDEAPQPSDDLPGMWHESDLSGGATDCVQPSDDVVKDAWIPVSERLPESATDVLVYGVNHGSSSYTVAGLFHGEWASQETEEHTRFEPTHWMPLPAAPEVKRWA